MQTAGEVDHALTLPPQDMAARLLELREDQWFERKSGRIEAAKLAPALVAFANAEGGHIVVGLHSGRIEGLSVDKVNELRQAAIDFTTPTVRARPRQVALDDETTLLILEVEPGEHVYSTHTGEAYLRVGDESRKLTFDQRQELQFDRGSGAYDATPVAANVSDINATVVSDYQHAIGARSLASALNARSLIERDGRLNVAGYLMFADHPQRLMPHAIVRVLRYTSNERGTGSRQTLAAEDDRRFEGTIPEQIVAASEYVESIMPARRLLTGAGRFESVPIIPRDAWLEGLVNAVVHRSYSMHGDHVRIELFPDRVEISSPGRFPGLVDPSKPLEIARHARNPRIARVCSDLAYTQELGEGIRRIYDEMQLRGLTDPVYRQSSAAVRLTLSAHDAIPQKIRDRLGRPGLRLLDALRQSQRDLSTGQLVDAVGLARPTVLRHMKALQEHGIVEWVGESPRDPRAVWRLL